MADGFIELIRYRDVCLAAEQRLSFLFQPPKGQDSFLHRCPALLAPSKPCFHLFNRPLAFMDGGRCPDKLLISRFEQLLRFSLLFFQDTKSSLQIADLSLKDIVFCLLLHIQILFLRNAPAGRLRVEFQDTQVLLLDLLQEPPFLIQLFQVFRKLLELRLMLKDVVQRVLGGCILLEDGFPHKPVDIHLFLSAGQKPPDLSAQLPDAALPQSQAAQSEEYGNPFFPLIKVQRFPSEPQILPGREGNRISILVVKIDVTDLRARHDKPP